MSTPTESEMKRLVESYFGAATDLESAMALSCLAAAVGSLIDDVRLAQAVAALQKPKLTLVSP